jgi:predicted nucleotide-binding protein (sugar kinase/HSP70/actin superfamily)
MEVKVKSDKKVAEQGAELCVDEACYQYKIRKRLHAVQK